MSGSDPTTWNPLADEPGGGDDGLMGGFTFDLDRALAAVDAAPIAAPAPAPAPLLITPAPEPLVVDTTPALDNAPPPSPPVAETTVLPQRTPSTGPIAAPAVASPSQPPASPAPANSRGSSTGIVPPGRRSLFEDAREGAELAELTRIPTLAELTLPEAPAAPPPDARPNAPSNQPASPVEIRQFRTAQARRSKQNRKGRVFGRMMLALAVLGGAIAGALTVGRRWVFPSEWSFELAPFVAQLEASRGPGFSNVVELVDQPASEYVASVTTLQIEGRLGANLPVWRALGLASGTADDPVLAERVAGLYTAVYDPEGDQIARRLGSSDGFVLSVALADAFAHHRGQPAGAADTGSGAGAAALPAASVALLGGVPVDDLTGVLIPVPSTAVTDAGAQGSADGPTVVATENGATARGPAAGVAAALELLSSAESAVDQVAPTATPTEPTIAEAQPTAAVVPDVSGLPLPLAYQLSAPARLASAIAAGPAGSGVDALGDTLRLAPAPTAGPDDTLTAAPTSLGIDDWTLVLANRISAEAVDRFVAGTVADAVVTFSRGDVQCVAATFESANEIFAVAAVQDLTAWAESGPAAAQAAVTAVTPLVTQVVSCDPGAEAVAPNAAAIDALVARQMARLAPAP